MRGHDANGTHDANEMQCAARATTLLDWSNAKLVASMEFEAYNAFNGGHASELLRGLWIWDDDAKRVRTRIPPEDSRVWIETDGERIDTAILVNTRLAILQSAAYGFTVPDTLADGRALCEFALAFSRDDHSISHFHRAWDEAFSDLRRDGFTDGLATCARRLLPLYQRMGARVIAEAEIRGEKRYFLHFDLARTSRWNARLVDARLVDGSGGETARTAVGGDANARRTVAHRETLIALARLRLVMDIARGQPDPAVGIDARRRGAHHVLATVRNALAVPEAAAEFETHRAEFARARLDSDDAEVLWNAVALFAELAQSSMRAHAVRMEATVTMNAADATDAESRAVEASKAATEAATEALDAMILALVEVWDDDCNGDDRGNASTHEAVSTHEAARLLAKIASDGLDTAEIDANFADLGALARPFIDASAAIARLASRSFTHATSPATSPAARQAPRHADH